MKILYDKRFHLLWWDVKGDGPHVHIDEAVGAGQDEEESCRKKSIDCQNVLLFCVKQNHIVYKTTYVDYHEH